MLEGVLVIQVEMVEVYRGPSELPPEFIGADDCAIALWTR
jgi:hypothetical protein